MSYVLAGSSIRRPNSMTEQNSTQMTQIRTLSGAVHRDFFGSNKRRWELNYENITKTDYDIINTIYQTYLSTGTAQTWSVTETNYSLSSTTVHLDLVSRDFNVRGSNYLSDFTLVLTEA